MLHSTFHPDSASAVEWAGTVCGSQQLFGSAERLVTRSNLGDGGRWRVDDGVSPVTLRRVIPALCVARSINHSRGEGAAYGGRLWRT